jgi:hypothetical protein
MGLSLDMINSARRDYAARELTVQQISSKYGISSGTLLYWVDGGPLRGERHLPPLPRRKGGVARSGRKRRPRGERLSVVRRLWRTADAQVRAIEKHLKRKDQPLDERERDARAMAMLVKAVRDLSVFDDTQTDTPAATNTTNKHDDIPRDIDEFRRELARRMDAFVERRTGTGVSRK